MTAGPQPKTLETELEQLLTQLYEGDFLPSELPQHLVLQINEGVETLQKTDRVAADEVRAYLLTQQYRYDDAKRAVENIKLLQRKDVHARTLSHLESNFLYASAGHQALEGWLASNPSDSYFVMFEAALGVGAFRFIVAATEKAQTEQRVMNKASSLIRTSREAVKVLDYFGVSDSDICSCVEEAGELLRRSKVLWLNTRPDVYVSGVDSDDPGVAIEYRLPLTSASASSLNSELAERLIEKDVFKPGFTIGFVGVRP